MVRGACVCVRAWECALNVCVCFSASSCLVRDGPNWNHNDKLNLTTDNGLHQSMLFKIVLFIDQNYMTSWIIQQFFISPHTLSLILPHSALLSLIVILFKAYCTYITLCVKPDLTGTLALLENWSRRVAETPFHWSNGGVCTWHNLYLSYSARHSCFMQLLAGCGEMLMMWTMFRCWK